MSESEEERRPRPIGAADDSEDSDVDRGNDTSAGASARAGDGPATETSGAAAPEEGKAKKPSKKMPAFSENDLVKEKGLRQIYNEFPRKCQYKGKGREAEFLRGLMVAYKEWGYQLYPGAAFEDLASRTEKLGGKARTRDLMNELRDTERDRVIEAKYGREAVENVRAQEAAKLAAKESKTAAAAAQDEAAEEGEDEELASSRYMEVDEGGAAAATGAAPEAASAAAAVISEQVRQRMEVNRRLALERLRKKKEEAAAAALEKENGNGAAPGDDDNDGGEMMAMDPMDVDAGDDVVDDDDDEAALADMEAEARAKETVIASGAEKSAVGVAGVASSFLAPAPSGGSERAADNAHSKEAEPEEKSSANSSTRREDKAVDGANRGASDDSADGVVDREREGEAGPNQEHGDSSGGGGGGANDAARKAAAAGGDEGSDASPAPPSGETAPPEEPARGDERGQAGETQQVASEAAPAAKSVDETGGESATLVDPAVGDPLGDDDRRAADAEAAATRRDEHATFSSPVKGKPVGGLPLSPLGNLFASTDVSAEGGTAAVRAPLAGLFSDENA